MPVQRTWSYLSWDEGSGDAQANFEAGRSDPCDVDGELQLEEDGLEANFKEISSQGDLKLFTIDPDEGIDDDLCDDNVYDSRSNDDISDEEHDDLVHGRTAFPPELLSEQDMSAVSLIE